VNEFLYGSVHRFDISKSAFLVEQYFPSDGLLQILEVFAFIDHLVHNLVLGFIDKLVFLVLT
jgi:hypothetical protein